MDGVNNMFLSSLICKRWGWDWDWGGSGEDCLIGKVCTCNQSDNKEMQIKNKTVQNFQLVQMASVMMMRS